MQANGKVFDCGLITHKALCDIEAGKDAATAGDPDEKKSGNGSLMRTQPVAIMAHRLQWSPERMIDVANRQSAVTHGSATARAVCALYSLLAHGLLNGMELDPALDQAFEAMHRHAPDELRARLMDIAEYPAMEFCRGSGYVVDSFWSAIHAVKRSGNYPKAVRAAIAYGNDTDTTACIAGGLAGILNGIGGDKGIPENLIAELKMPNDWTLDCLFWRPELSPSPANQSELTALMVAPSGRSIVSTGPSSVALLE